MATSILQAPEHVSPIEEDCGQLVVNLIQGSNVLGGKNPTPGIDQIRLGHRCQLMSDEGLFEMHDSEDLDFDRNVHTELVKTEHFIAQNT